MTIKQLLTVIFACIGLPAFSQSISGKVVNQKGEPLSSVLSLKQEQTKARLLTRVAFSKLLFQEFLQNCFYPMPDIKAKMLL